MTDLVFQESLGQPGINRDQTPFQTKNYVDGQHARWYNGEPRKIGGQSLCNLGSIEICRGLYGAITGDQIVFESGINSIYLYSGTASKLTYFLVNNDGQSLPTETVTPLTFNADINNLWCFDGYTDHLGVNNIDSYILAMVRPAASDIGTNNAGFVYYGLNGNPAPMVPLGNNIQLNGFILGDAPFIFIGGQNGVMIWNDFENNVFDFPDINFLLVSDTRLVAAKLIRGGSTTSLLIWSLTACYRITYTGITGNLFSKETLSTNVSIISQNCVVEVAPISTYYWIGKECFYQYNGVVSELINLFNKQWFFNNINRNAQEKCWTYVNQAFNEVWFYFPFGDATECTDAVIYNYLLKVWYNTRSAKAAGIGALFLSYPVQSDSVILNDVIGNGDATYAYWLQEFGTDIEAQGFKYAIKSYVRSHDRILASMAPSQDIQTRTRRFEPDLFLNGQMKLQIYTKKFPSSDYEISRDYFLRDPVTGNIGKVDIVNMGRIVSYYLESNEVGGFYQFGRSIIDLAPDKSERPSA